MPGICALHSVLRAQCCALISCCCDPCGRETNGALSPAPMDSGRWTAIPSERHHQECDYGERTMRLHLRTLVLGIVFAVVGPVALAAAAPPDEIANWNQMLFRMGLVGGPSPVVISRVAAIVQGAVFDA